MKVMNIIHDSIVDGAGLRTVIFFSGCPHRCVGCHNPSSWNIANGSEMPLEAILEAVVSNPLNNITLSGGEPFMQSDDLLILAKAIKKIGKNIWCYTGYLYEDIPNKEVLKYIDVLVDGQFEIDKRDLELLYKGSSNQRIIDVQKSLISNEIVLNVNI